MALVPPSAGGAANDDPSASLALLPSSHVMFPRGAGLPAAGASDDVLLAATAGVCSYSKKKSSTASAFNADAWVCKSFGKSSADFSVGAAGVCVSLGKGLATTTAAAAVAAARAAIAACRRSLSALSAASNKKWTALITAVPWWRAKRTGVPTKRRS